MTPSILKLPTPAALPPELLDLLERGNAGDVSVLPGLKKVFDDHPELVALLGDLARQAELSLLALVAGTSLTAREAISRHVAELRSRLQATAESELEKLLVERVVLSWLEVHYGDIDLAQHLLRQPGASPATQAAQKRLDRAHARFLTASKSLATVQKLIRPGLPTLVLLRPVRGVGLPLHGPASRPRLASGSSTNAARAAAPLSA
jgi:hypothetical protein